MRTIRWRNGQCPRRNGQLAERIAHAGSEAVRLVSLLPGRGAVGSFPQLSSAALIGRVYPHLEHGALAVVPR